MLINMRRRGKGLTLLELLLALLVVAGIVFTAMRIYGVARNNSLVAVAEHRVNVLAQVSYKWLQLYNQPDFCQGTLPNNCNNPITTQKLLDTNLVSPTDIQNPWGKPSSTFIAVAPGSDPKYVSVAIADLPAAVCQSLQQKFSQKAALYDGVTTSVCTKSNTFIADF